MDYRLHVFTEVATQQSISGAAKRLSISQPAVTQHIRLLEEAFNVPFFTRSRHGVTLTEEGLILLAHARRVASLEDELQETLQQPSQVFKGRLRLGASNTIVQYYLPKVLTLFKKQFPDISVEVLSGNSSSTTGALLDHRIDIGLIEGPCRRRDLRAHPFFEDEIVAIASPQNEFSTKRSITLRMLARASFIFREQGSGTRHYVEEYFQRTKIPLRQLHVIQELPSTEAIKRTVAMNMGLGFVSRLSITDEVKNGILKILPLPHFKIRRHFSTILPLGPDPVGLRQIFLKQLESVSKTPKLLL